MGNVEMVARGDDQCGTESFEDTNECRIADDSHDRPVVLFPGVWTMDNFKKQNPDIALFHISADAQALGPAAVA